MKKRHVTELTGTELSAAFGAAVSEAWQVAAQNGIDVFGRDDAAGHEGLAVRKPDGACLPVPESKLSSKISRKSAAA